MPNTHRRRRRDSTVEFRRVVVGGVYTICNDDCRQIRSTNKLTRFHSGITTPILIDINNFFNNDVIMSSLVSNLNSSTARKIVNWVTTADGCVHTADAIQLNAPSHVAKHNINDEELKRTRKPRCRGETARCRRIWIVTY